MWTRHQVKCWDYICEPADQILSSRARSLANQTGLHSKQRGSHVVLCDAALMWPLTELDGEMSPACGGYNRECVQMKYRLLKSWVSNNA